MDAEHLWNLASPVLAFAAQCSFVVGLAQTGDQFLAQLCDGPSTRQYRQRNDLKKENLRDHMTNMELMLNMQAEATTTEISREKLPTGFEESREIAQQGGTIAGNTRKAIEAKSGKPIISTRNAKQLK
jgi:hypothetical protein